jgi:hypothetical protein
MAQGTGILTELRLEAEGLSGRITCPPGLRPAPGQYLTAASSNPFEPLLTVLFPTGIQENELCLAPPLPSHWTAGMQLNLRGPLGTGFRLPGSARRVALSALGASPLRLLPVAWQALAQHAAVAVYTHTNPPGLPPEVEVLPLELLPEADGWADFLALDVPLADLPALRTRLGLGPFARPQALIQVLVMAAMPCSGLGECGVCAVPTRAGWQFACSDGPVFDFNRLEGF